MRMDTEPTSRLHDAPLVAALTRHERMMAEARRISAEWDGPEPPLDYDRLREDMASIADQPRRKR